MPVRLGTTRGCGPADSTTVTVVLGVTVSPALNPGCSGTIQLITMPTGNGFVEDRIGLLQHQPELTRDWSRRLFERQPDQVGQRPRRRAGADHELKRLVLLERRCFVGLGADDDSGRHRVAGFARDDGVPIESGDLVERLGLGESGEVRHLIGVRLIPGDRVGDAAGQAAPAAAAIGRIHFGPAATARSVVCGTLSSIGALTDDVVISSMVGTYSVVTIGGATSAAGTGAGGGNGGRGNCSRGITEQARGSAS